MLTFLSTRQTSHANYDEPLVYDEMFSEELGGVPNSELQSQKESGEVRVGAVL